MKLTSDQSADTKYRWKVVRRDDCTDVDGEIESADEDAGECRMRIHGEVKTFNFGADGIRIVRRK